MPSILSRADLHSELDRLLAPSGFSDYCPNGLQVEGRAHVRRLATAVTANQSVVDAAARWGADALLVHHGYFWRGEDPTIRGMKRSRLRTLLAAEMNLFAYHLPLDAHPELGNNARLGALLGFRTTGELYPDEPSAVGCVGELRSATSVNSLLRDIEALTGRAPLHVGDPEAVVRKVAWCTGGAQGFIDQAVARGAELYLSGEISEQTTHSARENGIHYVAAGHHATERYGVQAVAAHLAAYLPLEWRFFDADNPA